MSDRVPEESARVPGYAVLGRQLRQWLYSGIPASFLVEMAPMQERREYEGDQASHKTRVTVMKFGRQSSICRGCVDTMRSLPACDDS